MSQDLKSASCHRDGGCPNHHRHNCHILDVTNFQSANAQKDGGCANHDPRIVSIFDVADPHMSTITGMVHVPHHRGEGKDLNHLTRMVALLEEKTTTHTSGEGGGVNVFNTR